MILKKYTVEPRSICEDFLLKKLLAANFKTDGYTRSMESILKKKGFGLPVWSDEPEGFGFTINNRYTRYYLNYADALANEILLLRDLNMI
jgi:hypothetical protein